MFHKRKWEPQPDDAIKLAALRWFACTIESDAIQIYATNPGKYEVIIGIMRACVQELRQQRDIADAEDCPPGYVLCGKECAPMCDGEED
jgi:hypothetical protein